MSTHPDCGDPEVNFLLYQRIAQAQHEQRMEAEAKAEIDRDGKPCPIAAGAIVSHRDKVYAPFRVMRVYVSCGEWYYESGDGGWGKVRHLTLFPLDGNRAVAAALAMALWDASRMLADGPGSAGPGPHYREVATVAAKALGFATVEALRAFAAARTELL